MDHIGSRRLYELAQKTMIISEPEWEHIRDCSDCGKALILLTASFLPMGETQSRIPVHRMGTVSGHTLQVTRR
jgi:hypothetical protein